jgi:hypothetical protein
MKIVGISQTVSASIPLQPRRAIRFSVSARRLSVTTNVASALAP